MLVYHRLLLTGDELIFIFIRKLSSLAVEVAFRHSSTTFWTNVSSREGWLVLGVAFNPGVLIIVGKEEGESSEEWREEMPRAGHLQIVTVKGQIRDFASLSLSESHPRLL